MLPCPSIASTAFLHKFSTTQENKELFISTTTGCPGASIEILTLDEMRVCIYSTAELMDWQISTGTGSGVEPILEKRSAIISRRFTSFSISVSKVGSISFSFKYSSHAIKEDIKDQAKDRVKLNAILAAIVEAENIEVSDEDREAELADIAKTYNRELAEVKEIFAQNMYQIDSDILNKKALDIVKDNLKK